MAEILASQLLYPVDVHSLYLLADVAVTLLNKQQRPNQRRQQKKTNVKKNSEKMTKLRPSPPAPPRVQQQQPRAPAAWLLEQVAEYGAIGLPKFLCTKRLTASDTNRNLNRFAIPKSVVYDVLFPLMNDDEKKQVCETGGRFGGGGLRVQCHDGIGSLSLCFKLWQSNSMFLFNDGWKLVVERNGLRPEKDVLELWCFRDAGMALHFCIIRGEEEGNVLKGEEEGGLKQEEDKNGVVLEGEAMNGMNEEDVVSATQEKKEKENEEDQHEHWYRWVYKKRRT